MERFEDSFGELLPACYHDGMSPVRHIPKSSFIKGTWRNGRGISWDVASDQPFSQTGDFGWRFAVAEIAASGPFSLYGAVDRVFTLIEGHGVDLKFAGGNTLAVHQHFVPHVFRCDVATDCTLRGGISKALNLFTARGVFQADVTVLDIKGSVTLPKGASLLFVLQGSVRCGDVHLAQGDAAQIDISETCELTGDSAKLYVATLNIC